MSKYHNKQIVAMLSDGQTLPNATSGDSTYIKYIGGDTLGSLAIYVFANTAISVSTGNAFNIELEAYTAESPVASATTPFSKDNQGASPTAQTNAHYYLVHKTSADGALAWSAGDLITMIIIPQELLDKMSYDYIHLKYYTDENLSAQKVDAFIAPIA